MINTGFLHTERLKNFCTRISLKADKMNCKIGGKSAVGMCNAWLNKKPLSGEENGALSGDKKFTMAFCTVKPLKEGETMRTLDRLLMMRKSQ